VNSPWTPEPRPPRPPNPPPRRPGPPPGFGAPPPPAADEPARVVRSRAEVEHLLDDALATQHDSDPTLPHFVSDPMQGLAGVIATARWLLAHSQATPITRDHAPPTRAVWGRERARALDVIDGVGTPRPGITDDYAAFVRRTLDWVGIASASRPL
jgi:hypothetical protein